MPPKWAGLKTRSWLRLRAIVLDDEQRVCVWCWHGGSNAVNHTYPRSRFPHLAEIRSNLRAIHGIEGCGECAPHPRTGKPRACNTEVGNRILWVEAVPPGPRMRTTVDTPAGATSRDW